MSRPIQLLGDLPDQLRVLKETCEMEGSRTVSLRADELLGLVIVLTSSPAGLDVEILGDVAAADPAQVEAQIAAAVELAIADLKKQLEVRDATIVELKLDVEKRHNDQVDLLNKFDESQKKSVEDLLELEKLRKEHIDLLAQLGEAQTKSIDLAATLRAAEEANATLVVERDQLRADFETREKSATELVNAANQAKAAAEAKVTELTAQLAPFQAALAAAAAPKPAVEPTEK